MPIATGDSIPNRRSRHHGFPRPAAFTLIELLVVISIVALLIAILLPALDQAREHAVQVVCAAGQKQIAAAIFVYSEDHDSSLPPGHDGHPTHPTLWPGVLLPWTQNENIYECGTHLSDFPQHNRYVANGYWWGFWAQRLPGAEPTHLGTVKHPDRFMLITERTEDWERQRRGGTSGCAGIYPCPNGPSLLLADYQPKFNYYHSGNPGTKGHGGRHFRSSGSTSTEPWGYDNISFADGRVGTYSMQRLVEQSISLFWFEYPFVPNAGHANTRDPAPGPQPDAE